MKFEIIKKNDAGVVELRLFGEDGSITVWLCDTDQTAMCKLASLIYDRPDDEQTSKRSLLVGTFSKRSEKKGSMKDLACEIIENLKEEGFEEKANPIVDHPFVNPQSWPEVIPWYQVLPHAGYTVACTSTTNGVRLVEHGLGAFQMSNGCVLNVIGVTTGSIL